MGIAILTQLFLILLAGFFVWGLLPPDWKQTVKAAPWKPVAVIVVVLVIFLAVTKELLERREHRRAHAESRRFFERRPIRPCRNELRSGSSIMTANILNGWPMPGPSSLTYF